MKRRGGLGWMPARFSGPPTAEENFWRGLNLNGLTVYDVGAFEGLLTLFFARPARQVICYEPNARNRARLQANLRLNGLTNVTVRPFGLGETPVELQMVWDPSMPGGASVETAVVDNLRGSVAEAQAQPVSITTLDLDRTQQNLPAPDLIKIDIEGWELQALRGARETIAASMPALYLEMHGETMRDKMRKAAEIVDFLEHAGYPSIRHVESGETVNRRIRNWPRKGTCIARRAPARGHDLIADCGNAQNGSPCGADDRLVSSAFCPERQATKTDGLPHGDPTDGVTRSDCAGRCNSADRHRWVFRRSSS